MYGSNVFMAGDCCNTDAFFLRSSAVNSLRSVQNSSAPLSITIDATRSVILRRAVIKESVFCDGSLVRDFDVLQSVKNIALSKNYIAVYYRVTMRVVSRARSRLGRM